MSYDRCPLFPVHCQAYHAVSLQPFDSRLRAGIYAPVRLFPVEAQVKRCLFCPFGQVLLLLPGLLGGRVSAPAGIHGIVWGKAVRDAALSARRPSPRKCFPGTSRKSRENPGIKAPVRLGCPQCLPVGRLFWACTPGPDGNRRATRGDATM